MPAFLAQATGSTKSPVTKVQTAGGGGGEGACLSESPIARASEVGGLVLEMSVWESSAHRCCLKPRNWKRLPQ